MLREEYVLETKRTKKARQRIRHQIGEKVAEVYPNKINPGLQKNCFLTNLFVTENSKA
jgi:hypothetical protein